MMKGNQNPLALNTFMKWCFAFLVSPGSMFLWAYLFIYFGMNAYLNQHEIKLSNTSQNLKALDSQLTISGFSTDFWLNHISAKDVLWRVIQNDTLRVELYSPAIILESVDWGRLAHQHHSLLKTPDAYEIPFSAISSSHLQLSWQSPTQEKSELLCRYFQWAWPASLSSLNSSLDPQFRIGMRSEIPKPEAPYFKISGYVATPGQENTVMTKGQITYNSPSDQGSETLEKFFSYKLHLFKRETFEKIMDEYETLCMSLRLADKEFKGSTPSVFISADDHHTFYAYYLTCFIHVLKNIGHGPSEMKQTLID
jgi:hypothetical protein